MRPSRSHPSFQRNRARTRANCSFFDWPTFRVLDGGENVLRLDMPPADVVQKPIVGFTDHGAAFQGKS